MNNWRPLPSRGGLIGIIITLVAAALLGGASWLTWLAATATEQVAPVQTEDTPAESLPDFVTVHTGNNLGTFLLGMLVFVLLLAVLYLAYQTRRYFKMRYSLDRNAITIDLGDSKQVIPLANIRHIVPAETVLGQMRDRVYESSPAGKTGATGPASKAYPRARSETARTESVVETEVVEPEIAQAEAGPAHGMNQTAAADGNLEDLDVVQAEYVVIDEDSPADGGRPPEGVETGQVSDLEPHEVRSLAVDFDEKRDREEKEQAQAATGVNGGDKVGSVNFSVKSRPLSHWPGFYTHRAEVASLGPVQFYATQPLARTLLVRTASQTYAISPAGSQQFMTEFNLRRRLGAIEPVEEGVLKGAFLSHPLWHDRLGRGLIAAGVILNLLLYVSLLWRFDALNDVLRIHFNKLGQVDRAGDKGELMFLPFIGLLTLIGNNLLGAYLHPKERIPAYLLYAGAILLQILTAIAVLVILAVS